MRRDKCKECGGKGICEHGRQRNKCKECGGSAICAHGRERTRCKECGGGSICEHGKRRSRCKQGCVAGSTRTRLREPEWATCLVGGLSSIFDEHLGPANGQGGGQVSPSLSDEDSEASDSSTSSTATSPGGAFSMTAAFATPGGLAERARLSLPALPSTYTILNAAPRPPPPKGGAVACAPLAELGSTLRASRQLECLPIAPSCIAAPDDRGVPPMALLVPPSALSDFIEELSPAPVC